MPHLVLTHTGTLRGQEEAGRRGRSSWEEVEGKRGRGEEEVSGSREQIDGNQTHFEGLLMASGGRALCVCVCVCAVCVCLCVF